MKTNQLTGITPVQVNDSVNSVSDISFTRVLMGGVFEIKYVNAGFRLSPSALFHFFYYVELHQL